MTVHVIGFTARDNAVTMLDADEVDVAIGVPSTFTSGRIFVRPLFQKRLLCEVRKDHPLINGTLDLPTFLKLNHLLVSPENDRFGHGDVALAKQGLKRNIGLTLQ